MGLNYNDVRCLMEWRGRSSGGRVATLGHLTLMLHPADIAKLRRELTGDNSSLAWLERYRWGDFADDMFREMLRFDDVTSLDFSAFEGATVVQDISAPLREGLAGQFDLAVDGGTLEHVFNFPAAVANLMRLVRVGGAVYTHSPCNNLAGHGFYQFSPELMHRIFSAPNGFETRFVRIAMAHNLSVEQTTGHAVYDVIDPAKYGGRVMLVAKHPTVMMCLAIKHSACEPFAEPVLQSDYLTKWSGETPIQLNWKGKTMERLSRVFPLLRSCVAGFRDRREASVQNRTAYRRLW